MPTDSDSHTAASSSPGPRGGRYLRRLLQALGGLAALIITVALMLLLLLQTSWGAGTAAQLAARYANPFTDAAIHVGGADGNWLQTLELHDVALVPTGPDAAPTRFAHLDTLRVRYSLPSLLRSTLHVQEVTLAGPAASLRQRADSTWTLPTLPSSEPEPTDTTAPAFAVRVDAVHIRRGRMTAQFYTPRGDSTLRVRGLWLGARDLRYASPLTGQLDTLGFDAVLPGIETPLQFQAAGTLADDRFTLDDLRLSSPHSDVRGAGTVRLAASPEDALDDIDFSLTAAPLAFRDVAPFLPTAGLNPRADLRLDVQAQGSGRLLQLRTEAALSTGGSVTLDATATPLFPADVEQPTPDPLRYRLDAQARDLNTTAFAPPDSSAPTHVNADLQVDLSGPALSRLSGTVTTRLFDTQVTGYAVQLPQLQLRFADGQAAVTGQGQFAGAAFAVEGTMAPFATAPTYDLRTQLSDFDVGAFAADAGLSSTLNTQLQLTGTGFAVPDAQLTAELDVLPSTFNAQRIDAGQLTLRLQRDSLRYDAQLAFPEGRLAAAGSAQLTAPLTYAVEQGRFERVDVAALRGDTTASALSGAFRLRGQDVSPTAMRLQADVQLQDSHYGGYVLQTASLRLGLEQGRATLDASADLQGGRFELAAVTEPFAASPTLRVTQGRFRDVDLGPLLQDSTQHSALNGAFRLRGADWTAGSFGTWAAEVRLDPSRLNQQPLQAAQLEATLQQERLDATLQLDTPEGRSRFAGYARPFDATPTYAITEGTLTALDLGALAGLPSARTALNGTLTVQGRGVDPTTLSLDAQLDLAASAVNRAQLEQGTLQARFDQGEGTLDSRFDFAQGRMTLAATARPQDEQPSYRLQGQVENVNAAALAGLDSLESALSLDIDLDGVGLDPSTLQFTSRIAAQPSRFAAVRLDTLDARLQMQDGLLQVDTLLALTNVGTARGGGQVALSDPTDQYESNFFVEAQTTDVAPLQSVLDAQQLSLDAGRVEGRIYGNPGTLRFDALATLTNLAYEDLRLADVEAQLAGARGDTTAFSALEVRGRVGYLSYSTFSVEDTRFDARYEEESVDFNASLTVDRERNARLDGTVDLRPGRERVVLQTLDMKLGPDRWTLLQDASIAYGEAYRINNLLLYSGQQQLAADGTVDFDGTQSLIVTLDGVEIGTFTDLLGLEGLGGRLSGTLDMSGAAESPQIASTLHLDVRSSDQEVGQLQLGLNYDSLHTRIDALLAHRDGSTLTMTGQVPTDLRLSATDTSTVANDPVDLTLTAETFSIGWIDPFIDPTLAQNVSGQFDADVSIGGTLDAPVLDGSGTIRDGRLDLSELGTTYDRITADLTFTEERVQMRQVAARSAGGGRLRAQGAIDLTDLTLGAYDLTVTTTNFLAIDTRAYRARVDSDLEVTGSTERPVVRGSAQVESANIYIVTSSDAESELATVQLSEDDRQTIERRFGIRLTEADATTFDAYAAMAMDLTVQFERDTWIRSRSNPKMNIQFTGDLDVQKEHGEQDTQVFGTIEVIPERSRVVQFGREFQIAEGVLTFNGPATEPVMDIQATYGIRARASRENEATITLSITGRPEDLNLTLNSNPPMDTYSMLSYLATGRPPETIRGAGSDGAASSDPSVADRAEQLALGQATGLIENLAASKLGLDVVRIEPMPDGSVFLTAGQYLSPRFYAAVQQSITDDLDDAGASNVPDITLEYELTRWLLMRSLYRNPDLRFNLFWEYAY